jgi:hypothetical protein
MIALPQTLAVNRGRLIFGAALGLSMATFHFMSASHNQIFSYAMIAMFGLATIFNIVLLLPSMNTLTLDHDGFEIKSGLAAARRVKFTDVSDEGFWVDRGERPNHVVWRYAARSKSTSKTKSAWRIYLWGDNWHDHLPGNYGGYKPAALAELLDNLKAAQRT